MSWSRLSRRTDGLADVRVGDCLGWTSPPDVLTAVAEWRTGGCLTLDEQGVLASWGPQGQLVEGDDLT